MSKAYTTTQGDMWDLIAFKVYGNEMYISTLLAANERYKDVAVFPQGVVLECPDASTASVDILPPWRR